MSERRRTRALPIRRWLAIALVIVVVVPMVVAGGTAAHFVGAFEGPEAQNAIRERLRDNPDRWDDPQWREDLAAEFASQGADFMLVIDGVEIFQTSPDLLTRTNGPDRTIREVVIDDANPPQRAYIFTEETGPPGENFWLIPIVAVSVFLLTIGAVAWFFGRTVIAPLSATSEAARQVAAGNLQITLPSSRVREVADLNAAFETMSAELRASLEQQAEVEQERRMLISSVAHDLRTPLFSLRGSLEGLEKGVADTPEKRNRYIAVAQEKADALERLIADLFAYTRLEYLDQTPSREPLNFGDLMHQVVSGLRPQAEVKGVDLVVRTPPSGSCAALGDAHLLTRALMNLLDNALRYTPEGGTIEVECLSQGGELVFTVTDSGPGIPEGDLPHIFTPLFRGETSRNRRTGGAGLGLTIAHRILQAHGGDLRAANAPTGGAAFTGTLPSAGQGVATREGRAATV